MMSKHRTIVHLTSPTCSIPLDRCSSSTPRLKPWQQVTPCTSLLPTYQPISIFENDAMNTSKPSIRAAATNTTPLPKDRRIQSRTYSKYSKAGDFLLSSRSAKSVQFKHDVILATAGSRGEKVTLSDDVTLVRV